MASLHMLLWALVAALVRVACGQDTTPSLSLDAFPDCAVSCLLPMITWEKNSALRGFSCEETVG